MEKKLGQIRVSIQEENGTGTSLQLSDKELKELGLKINDWVKFTENKDGNITMEKTSPCDHCHNGHIESNIS